MLCMNHVMTFSQRNAIDSNSGPLLVISPQFGCSFNNISYSIAGNEQGESPNILSELIWSNLYTIDYGVEAKGKIIRKIPFEMRYIRSTAFRGNVSDIDYAEDNRKAIFSEQYLSSHDGFGTHINGLIGYNVFDRHSFSLSCLIGFDFLHQRAYLLNRRGVNDKNNSSDYVEGLRSYYSKKWKSFGINIWADCLITGPLSIHMEFGTYKSSYNAYGNWNLIPGFAHPKSYTHKGNGVRINYQFKLCYELNQRFRFNVSYDYKFGLLNDGKDLLFLKSEGIQKTKLNQVSYNANSARLGIAYTFLSNKL